MIPSWIPLLATGFPLEKVCPLESVLLEGTPPSLPSLSLLQVLKDRTRASRRVSGLTGRFCPLGFLLWGLYTKLWGSWLGCVLVRGGEESRAELPPLEACQVGVDPLCSRDRLLCLVESIRACSVSDHDCYTVSRFRSTSCGIRQTSVRSTAEAPFPQSNPAAAHGSRGGVEEHEEAAENHSRVWMLGKLGDDGQDYYGGGDGEEQGEEDAAHQGLEPVRAD